MCCDTPSPASATAGQDNEFSKTLSDIAKKQQARAETVYQPIEDQLIQQVDRFNTPEYSQEQQALAKTDVANAFDSQRQSAEQRADSLGLNPADPRSIAMNRGLDLGEAAATASGSTVARRTAEATGFNARAGIAGKGDAKIQQAIQAAGQGGNIYMAGLANDRRTAADENAGESAGFGQLLGTGLSIGAMFL